MATSSGTGDSPELPIFVYRDDEDPDTLLQRILNWHAAHSPEPDIIYPEWADEEPWSLQALHRIINRHEAGLKDPRIDCWVEAYDSNDIQALWSCGMYEYRSLPYLYTPEAKIFAAEKSPGQHWSSRIPRPGHRRYDHNARSESAAHGLCFRTCYACAGIFEFALDHDKSTYIWAGVPPAGVEYTAISYVWGDVADMVIRCSSCDHLTQFPFSSINKFREIMAFVGPERVAWLDAISIDQGNPEDLKTQMAQMGSIYKHAATVSVFLPHSDTSGYELLETLSRLAKQIMNRPADFMIPLDKRHANWPSGESTSFEHAPSEVDNEARLRERHHDQEDIASLCLNFLETFEAYRERSSHLKYWQRAWTFQEWSLAVDLDIFIEAHPLLKVLTAVKTSIFSAACLLCQHKVMGCYGLKLHLDIDQDAMRLLFEDVKHCFPLEDFMLVPSETNPDVRQYQDQLPFSGCDQLLGLRIQPRKSSEELARARLHIMLTAFDKTRSAKFEADLVACWAAMCNLRYDYNRKDDIMLATTKVIKAIRNTGLEIFEFFPCLQDRAIRYDCLPTFFLFAERHFAQNYRVQGFKKRNGSAMYNSLPVFTGRCDPVIHLQQSLLQDYSRFSGTPQRIPHPSMHGRDPVQMIKSVLPTKFSRVSDIDEAVAIWKDSLYGWVLEPTFADVGTYLEAVVASIPSAVQLNFNIVQYHIPAQRPNGSAGFIRAWALTPITVPVSMLETVRRVRDGVFALVYRGVGECYLEVAYLTVTDQVCGTLLVRSDETGLIDLQFEAPPTRNVKIGFGADQGSRDAHERRHLHGRVTFEPWLHHLLHSPKGYHRGDLLGDPGCPHSQNQALQ